MIYQSRLRTYIVFGLIMLYGCSDRNTRLKESYSLEQGIYICVSQKLCAGCISKFKFLKEEAENLENVNVCLIVEMDSIDSESSSKFLIEDIENLIGFKFSKVFIDEVNFEGLFNRSCGYLCNKRIVYSPAIIIVGKSERTLFFKELFVGLDLNIEIVKEQLTIMFK
jgi:hypothetical protein